MNVDTTEKSPVILSLCSGFGGLERGIERATGGIKVAAYVEIEAFIIENLLSLMEQGILDTAPVWSDLKTFDGKPFHGKIHGIVGGYPCQPFSNAGSRKGTDDPRHLWPYIQQIVSAVRPVWCFFENVSGHLSLGFDEVYRSLSDMGYTVEAGIFTAQEVGAPHERERLFILAVSNSNCFRHGGIDPRGFQPKIIGSGEELGNSQHNGQLAPKELRWCNEAGHGSQKGQESTCQSTGADRRNCGAGLQGCQVAYTHNSGFKKQRDKTIFKARNSNHKSIEEWPLGPGSQQHEWEEQRTIKSGMGCTINGYNFREDLLRMYGNGVVEQTSELAWVTLWKKF